MAIPIWKDKFCNLGAVASQYFRIRVSSTTIYQGRAFRAASSGNLYIRINDICADYMAQTPPPVPNSTPAQVTFPMSFTVQKSSNGSSWTTVETVDFWDDWSYDTNYDPTTDGMYAPITGRIDLRQMLFQTRHSTGSVTATARYGSTTRSITLTLKTSASYGAFGNGLIHAGKGYIEFDAPTYATYSSKTLTSVSIGLATYEVAKGCPRYCLYYKNPFGGYDHLLLEGTVIPHHSVQRDTYKADYDNSVRGREEWNYMNEVTEGYTCNTGLLSDDESSRMPYLLDSTEVYICDLLSPTVFIPVVIATDSYSVQSFQSNGNKRVNCTFDVKVAQNKYRR